MKPIKITKEAQKAAIKKFTEYLNSSRSTTGQIDFRMSMAEIMAGDKTKVKPLITITPLAYCKMMALVQGCAQEIAWRGTVQRLDDYNFRILDVYCYPQKIAPTTVESDDDKYPLWLNTLEDDVYNTLRFQGHSHVNMGTNPSGVDTSNWESFLQNLNNDSFMIFCIANKRHDIYWTLYDLKTNLIFEPKDIEFAIEATEEYTIQAWAEDTMEEMLKKPANTYRTVTACAAAGGPSVGFGSTSFTAAEQAAWFNNERRDPRSSAIRELMSREGSRFDEHY